MTTRAIDVDVLIDGARAALLANSTVAAAVAGRIGPNAMPPGTTYPYIVLARPTVVYNSPYQLPLLNALIDVSVYDREETTDGWDTSRVRAVAAAAVSALIDHPWTIAGLRLIACEMESDATGYRTADEVVNGVMTRGRQFTVRVRAQVT